MGGLSNYRAVGKFDVLEAPRSPTGLFDAEQFKKDALDLFDKGSNNIVVDLGNLDFLYSDAFNAFSTIHQKLESRAGSLGILAMDDLAVQSLQNSGVDRYVKVFRKEPELMAATLQTTVATPPRATTVIQVAAPVVTAAPAEPPPLKRTHKFTQSFNSSLNSPDSDGNDLKGLPNAFDSMASAQKVGSSTWKWVVLAFLLIAGGAIAWYFLR
jgi:anti-anti-sigma regulatory factor